MASIRWSDAGAFLPLPRSSLAMIRFHPKNIPTSSLAFLASGALFSAAPEFSLTAQTTDPLGDYSTGYDEDGTTKEDVHLDNLKALSLGSRLDLLNKIQEQLQFQDMPPKKKDQPYVNERAKLIAWI